MEETQDLSKQTDFNNLTCKKMCLKFLQVLIPLGFHRNKDEGDIALEKVEEQQKQLKSKINEIIVGSKNQKSKKVQEEILKP